ncbi:MAG: PhzF family isomerase [Desulfobacteraceae bacterium]|nr:PhzF family isomerase [Desulfobacteraceae bacterium]
MKKLIVYQINSFTKEKFTGNPAGVVLNADGLNEIQMQLIARELNNSETAFLFSADDKNCDGQIRYFTPTRQVPICGHATIAAMYAKAMEDKLEGCILNIKTKIGVLPFEIIKESDDYKVIMTQGAIQIDEPLNEQIAAKLINLLGLKNEDLNPKCPLQIASTGHSKVMIGIKSREKLNKLTPDFDGLSKLSNQINCNGYFVFTFDSNEKNILTYGRMFAPLIGINEDPVTGNANGPLGAYLVHNKIIDFDSDLFEFKGKQGEAVDRSGVVDVKVKIANKKPVSVQIKGDAVVIFKTEIII